MMIIESAQQIHRRHQLYLWSQGVLQSFLPHELLIFGSGDFSAAGFRSDILARTAAIEANPIQEREFACLTRMMLDAWQECGRQPRFHRADAGGCAIAQSLHRLGIDNALTHGAREFSGESSAFFVFLRLPEVVESRLAYFAEMFMPYLHTALHRMLRAEKTLAPPVWEGGVRLSPREAEVVVLLRDGKTNQQIAESLELSPSTVKNHVQNILRKLEVGNRAQAVAKAVKARLIEERNRY